MGVLFWFVVICCVCSSFSTFVDKLYNKVVVEDVFNTAKYENVEKRVLDNDNKVHFKITSWEQKEHSTHVYIMIVNNSNFDITNIKTTIKLYDRFGELIDVYVSKPNTGKVDLRAVFDVASHSIDKSHIVAYGLCLAHTIKASFEYDVL